MKPVVAWAIKSPDGFLNTESVKPLRRESQAYWAWLCNYPWKTLYSRGYRAVKVEIREVEE